MWKICLWLVRIPVVKNKISCLRDEEKLSLVISSLKKQENHRSVRFGYEMKNIAYQWYFLLETHEKTCKSSV